MLNFGKTRGGVMSVDSAKKAKKSEDGRESKLLRPTTRAKSAAERFSKWVYRSLESGIIGALFTSYKSGDENRTPGARKKDGVFSSAADMISDAMNSGRAVHALKSAAEKLLCIRLRVIGTFFAAFGIYTVLYAALVNFLADGSREIYDIFAGVLFTVISFPFIFSDDTLSGALRTSSFGKALAALGLNVENAKDTRPFGKLNIGFIAGVAAGILSYFSSPYKVVFLILLSAFIWIVASKPEIGVVAASFILPFVSTETLILILAATALSFTVKLVRGKRYATFETLDASVFGMLLVILLGGIVSISQTSYKDSILYAVLTVAYFLAANLLKSRAWLERMCAALVFGTAVASGIYTVCAAAGLAMSGASEAVGEIFGNSIASLALAGDLSGLRLMTVAVLPMALSMLIRPTFGSGKNAYVWIAIAALMSPMIISPSAYAVISASLSVLLLLLICTRKSVFFVIGAGVCVGGMYVFFPPVFEKICTFFGTGIDRFFETRVSLWHSAGVSVPGNMFGGIGFGGSSFTSLFENSLRSAEVLPHVYNTYLQLWIETGIVGLIMFIVFIWLFVCASFTLISQIRRASIHPAQRSRGGITASRLTHIRKISVAAPFCGVAGLLVSGLFDYIWYDERVFLMFWLTAGLAAAEIRATRREIRDIEFSYRSESVQKDAYEIDIEA